MSKVDAANLSQFIFDRWNANHQVVWIVSDEPYRCQTQIQEAARQVNTIHKQNVKVAMQDKAAGLYDDRPRPLIPTDKTNTSITALQVALSNQVDLSVSNPGVKLNTLPFALTDNVIVVFKDWDVELAQPMTVEFVRNAIQSNMGSGTYYKPSKNASENRGRRMLVFITTTDTAFKGADLPEIKPHHVPLPDRDTLSVALTNMEELLTDAYTQTNGKKGIKEITSDQKKLLLDAGAGVTYQYYEDSLSLAFSKHKTLENMDTFLDTMEVQKAAYVTGIPGCIYIPKSATASIGDLPGFEVLDEFIDDRMGIDPDVAKRHGIQPIRGVALGGAPGLGKTTVGMAIARRTGRILINVSLGEIQGSLVGESETNMRRAIQIIQATKAVALIDDVDKGGVSMATGASKTAVEGGPFGRMIQMLLTEMSSPENQAMWVFTFNRAHNIPGELLRPGRMDARYYVDYPDAATRANILAVHLRKRNFPSDDKVQLDYLALDENTDGWSGAELENLIQSGVIKAVKAKQTKVDFNYLVKTAKLTTPMRDQAAYKEDIAHMRETCKDFTPIGKTKTDTDESGKQAARAKRTMVI